MGILLLSTAGWILAAWVPGVVWLSALAPGRGWLRNAVAAPVVSLGALMAWAQVASLVGLSVSLLSVWVPVVLVGSALHVPRLRRGGVRAPRMSLPASERRAILAVSVIAVAAAVLWLRATDLLGQVPPNDDGSHHGLFTERIIQTGSIDPRVIGVGDIPTGEPHVNYYPLAMHIGAAFGSRLGHAAVPAVLDVGLIMAVAIVFPFGMYVLTRRCFPAAPGAAVVAALACIAFPEFPYFVSYWGGLPFILGICFVPISVDALLGDEQQARWWKHGMVSGLVLVGLFSLHQSEFLLAVGMTAVLAWAERSFRIRQRVLGWLLALGILVAFVLPQWSLLTATSGQLATVAPLRRLPAVDAAAQSLGFLLRPLAFPLFPGASVNEPLALVAMATSVLLAGVGALVSLTSRRGRAMLVAWAIPVLATFALAVHVPLAARLGFAWYSRWDRMVLETAVTLPVFIGLGAVRVWGSARMRLSSPSRLPRAVGTAAAVGVLVLALGPGIVSGSRMAGFAFHRASLVRTAGDPAFSWLAHHVPPGERVLNDFTDGSGWLWTMYQVDPLFAAASHSLSGWGDRTVLLAHADRVGVDPAITAIADEWQVRYCLIRPDVFPGRKHALSLAAMRSAPGWHLVFEDPRSGWVFETVNGG